MVRLPIGIPGERHLSLPAVSTSPRNINTLILDSFSSISRVLYRVSLAMWRS